MSTQGSDDLTIRIPPSSLRDGEIHYEEPDSPPWEHESGDGYFEESTRPVEYYNDIEVADLLYTRDWTQIETDAQAQDFITYLFSEASENEREYIRNIHFGESTAEAAIRMVDDKIEGLKEYLAADEDQKTIYKESLRDTDAHDTSYDDLYLEYLERERQEEYTRPSYLHQQIPVYGGGQTVFEDPHDLRIYRLLQFADALHDFDPMPPKKKGGTMDRKHILTSMNIQIPVDLVNNIDFLTNDKLKDQIRKDPDLPEDYIDRDYDMIASIPAFMEYMKENGKVTYPDGSQADNPLVDIDLLRRFDVHEALNLKKGQLWDAFRMLEFQTIGKRGIISPEVWCPLYEVDREKTEKIFDPSLDAKDVKRKIKNIKTHKRTVYLAQITKLVSLMKNYFTADEVTFILDESDNQLLRMVMATEKIDAAISREFIVKDSVESDTKVISDKAMPRLNWNYKICDANIFDGPRHIKPDWYDYADPEISKEATGSVYRPEDPYKINLLGVNDKKEVTFSLNGAPPITQDHDKADYSTKSMAFVMQTRLKLGATDLNDPLTCKRVCDWGQVEHCKSQTTSSHRYVFVSSDRLAAFYAVYRGVSVLSLNRRNHRDFSVPTVSELLQLTFTMSKPEAIDAILDPTGTVVSPLIGGGLTNLFLPIVLGAVTIAMSLFAR